MNGDDVETDNLYNKFTVVVDPDAAPVDWEAFFTALDAIVERNLANRANQPGTLDRG